MPLSQVVSIRIQGRVFGDQSTELQLFQKPEKNRLSFIFGENGSGKSTIAQCLALKRLGELPPGIKSFDLTDASGHGLKDENTVLRRTFVFDELFIEKNVHVTGDDIESIIMLGGRSDLETAITKVKQDETDIKSLLKTKKDRLAKISESRHDLLDKLETTLKADHGWADREKEILGNKNKARVAEEKLKPEYWEKIATSETDVATLREKITRAIDTLNNLQNFEAIPLANMPQAPLNDEIISALLSFQIKQPTSTVTQGTRLQEILEKYGSTYLEKIDEHFSDQNTTFCPFCLRDITPEFSTELINLIHQLLDKATTDHILELKKCRELIKEVPTPNFELYRPHFSDEVAKCEFALKTLRQTISSYLDLLTEKINNPYQVIDHRNTTYDSDFNNFIASIATLNKTISERNKQANQHKHIKEEAQSFNLQLAKFEILLQLNELEDLRSEEKDISEQIAQFNSDIIQLERERKNLQAEMSNISIALEVINRNLSFIFADRRRLELQGTNGRYSLYSRGEKVKPFNVSTGERNAIALCYFISLLNQNESIKSCYSDEMLVIFDDPVSSFDYSNRLGIISFLRSEFIKILAGNPNSKVICLTHDGALMNNFEDMIRGIQESLNRKHIENTKGICCFMQLADARVSPWKLEKRSYSDILSELFRFSTETVCPELQGIGNLARRALEAFSSFEFNAGPSDALFTASAHGRITNPKLSEYFERNLLHFVLNSESHSSDNVQLQAEINAFPAYSPAHVQQSIRDVLCFLYAVDKNHLLSHLEQDEKKIDLTAIEKVLDRWTADIESSIA